jgi:hypothetical protein
VGVQGAQYILCGKVVRLGEICRGIGEPSD